MSRAGRLVARLLLAGALVGPIAVGPTSAAQEAQGEPTVTLDARSGLFGEELGVRGSGWMPNTTVFVELCGNEARNGTPDCDQENARLVGVGSSGAFAVPLLVAQPPSPCPCVVRVSSQGGPAVATAPVEVPQASFAELDDQNVDPQPRRQLSLNASIGGSDGWMEWFGAPPERTAVITVENVGDVAVHDPDLSLAFGRGDDPTGYLESPEIGSLAPGESTEVAVPLDLGLFAVGDYTVTGDIAGFDEPASFRAETSSYPWVVIVVLPVLLLQFVLLRIRDRVRSRLHPDLPVEEEPPERGAPPALPPPAPAALVPGAPALPGVVDVRSEDGALEDLLVDELVKGMDRVLGSEIRPLTAMRAQRVAERVASEVESAVADRTDLSRAELGTLTRELADQLARKLAAREALAS